VLGFAEVRVFRHWDFLSLILGLGNCVPTKKLHLAGCFACWGNLQGSRGEILPLHSPAQVQLGRAAGVPGCLDSEARHGSSRGAAVLHPWDSLSNPCTPYLTQEENLTPSSLSWPCKGPGRDIRQKKAEPPLVPRRALCCRDPDIGRSSTSVSGLTCSLRFSSLPGLCTYSIDRFGVWPPTGLGWGWGCVWGGGGGQRKDRALEWW
jgi:hypothetical protein